MSATRRITMTFSLLLIVCLVGSVLLVRRLGQLRPQATLTEVLYVPSPKVLKRLSLGYDGLLADIYWTRAVQYFGGKRHAGADQYALLAPLLEITTTLDPHLIVAYEFGGNFLAPKPPNGAGMPRAAIDLAEYGIRHNPNEWRLYYNLGFVYYMELKDYAGAADAFRRGSQVPNAHPWLKIMAAQMAERAGDLQTARLMWVTTYQTSQDTMIRANAAAHLRALQVDETVPLLESLVSQYRERTGSLPSNLSDLVTAGILREVPVDPLGNPYRLMPDGRIEVAAPDDLPFIQKGTPPGYVAPRKPKLLPSD